MSLIRTYRHRGHLVADLDPLKMGGGIVSERATAIAELKPSYYEFSEADLEREFVVSTEMPGKQVRRLREIIEVMERAYTGKIGIEYRHILSKEEGVYWKLGLRTFPTTPLAARFM